MTAAQRATLEIVASAALEEKPYRLIVEYGYEQAGSVADALRAALGTCGNCAHADTDNAPDGSAYCTARMDDAHPFAARRMPLGERCTGWTAKEGA